MNSPVKSPPGLPLGVFLVPALVVLGVLGFALQVASRPANLDKLGPTLGLVFGAIPVAICFLSIYFWAVYYLRARRPQWGSGLVVGAATLIGLTACAAAICLLLGAFALEAMLR